MLQFLNDDLVFDQEPSRSPSWRAEKLRTLVYNKNINSLPDSSDSESGLWHRTLRTFHRIKRGLWDFWETEETSSATQGIESTTEVKEFTPEQDTSNT